MGLDSLAFAVVNDDSIVFGIFLVPPVLDSILEKDRACLTHIRVSCPIFFSTLLEAILGSSCLSLGRISWEKNKKAFWARLGELGSLTFFAAAAAANEDFLLLLLLLLSFLLEVLLLVFVRLVGGFVYPFISFWYHCLSPAAILLYFAFSS